MSQKRSQQSIDPKKVKFNGKNPDRLSSKSFVKAKKQGNRQLKKTQSEELNNIKGYRKSIESVEYNKSMISDCGYKLNQDPSNEVFDVFLTFNKEEMQVDEKMRKQQRHIKMQKRLAKVQNISENVPEEVFSNQHISEIIEEVSQFKNSQEVIFQNVQSPSRNLPSAERSKSLSQKPDTQGILKSQISSQSKRNVSIQDSKKSSARSLSHKKSEDDVKSSSTFNEKNNQNAIISEEDSAFGNESPAQQRDEKMDNLDFNGKVVQETGVSKKKGSLPVRDYILSEDNDKIFRKQKTSNQKVLNQIYTKSPHPKGSSRKHKTKSNRGFLSQFDKDSGQSRIPKTFLKSQQRDQSPDLPELKKQSTQGHEKKKPVFHRKQSRENSLNFTVDNQIDCLSVNFRQKQRLQKDEEGIQQGTFSLSSVVTKRNKQIMQSRSKEASGARLDEEIKEIKEYPNGKMVNIYLQKPYQIQKKRQNSNSPVRLFQAENILNLAGTKPIKIEKKLPISDEFTTFQPPIVPADNSPVMPSEFNIQGNSIFSNINNLTNRTTEMQAPQNDSTATNTGGDDKEFWISLYDKFLMQLDKRIEYLSLQIQLNSKRKNLCSIYGQTFTSINFGSASYAPLVGPQDSPISPKQRKKKINADLTQPLLSKRSVRKVDTEMNEQDIVMKLNLEKIPDFNSTEGSQVEDIATTEGSNRQPQQEDKNDLLKIILAHKDRMGYSHQQLKYLREKEKQLEQLEAILGKQELKLSTKQSDQKKKIKSFYPEVQEPPFLKNNSVRNTHINSLKQNKQAYIERINQHRNYSLVEDQNLSNIKRNKNYFLDNAETFQDYFGTKISMRRSIEQNLVYDSKKFKYNTSVKVNKNQEKSILRESLPIQTNFVRENRINILSGLVSENKTQLLPKIDENKTPFKIQSVQQSKKKLVPLKDENSPIRVKRNKFIEETKRESQNSQLNFQYKNVSPRLPPFRQNRDFDDLINDLYKQRSSNQNPYHNKNIQSSNYGVPNKLTLTKTTKILQGFLNEQRLLNRVIQNGGVMRSTNSSDLTRNVRNSSEINCIYDNEEVTEMELPSSVNVPGQ